MTSLTTHKRSTLILYKINIYVPIIVIACITSILSFSICIINDDKITNGYDFICFLPLIYLIISFPILVLLNQKNVFCRITISIYLIIQWLRMVLCPMTGAMSGYFSTLDSHVTEQSAQLAVRLIIYEACITCLFCCFLCNKLQKKDKYPYEGILRLRGTYYLYILFILIGLFLFLSTGADQFQFFMINLSEERFSETVIEDTGSVTGAIISYSLTFFVILVLFLCYEKYRKTLQKKYVYYALICALLRLCFISSEGRMSQVYLFGAFILLLPRLFPEYKGKIKRYLIIVAIAVIGLMTVYKTFAAFLYDSYLEALQNNTVDLSLISSQIDVYLYGVKTVGRNLSFCIQSDLNISEAFFDFLRNTFGLHYIIKNAGHTTLEYYNMYMYGDSTTSGHLLSGISYGYLYLGSILAPVAVCFNLYVAAFTERVMKSTPYIEIYYLAGVIFMRLCINVFANFSFNWNFVSRTIILSAIVIGCSSILKKRRNKL